MVLILKMFGIKLLMYQDQEKQNKTKPNQIKD